eukprot:gb/GECG01002554.1/.p1 GENE.gb/GECG01002554.1/~~gb/GECG01002554.1/.p1  ORF type:complete len:296 (+),score=20.85 gb/GECG01002554.1/:1-888(+)
MGFGFPRKVRLTVGTMNLTKHQQLLLLSGILFTGFLGVWTLFSIWTVYNNRFPVGYMGINSDSVPDFGDSYTFRKELFHQWHWTYVLEGDERWRIEQLCPTLKHDAKLVYDRENDIVAASNHKVYAYEGNVWNTISKTLVRDASGKVIYVVRSGNLWETLINANRIWVTLEIKDGNDDLLLGFSDSENWGITQSISLKLPNGAEEVRLHRTKLSLSEWKWRVEASDKQLNDPRLIAMIIAKYAFDEHGSKYRTDLCNWVYFLLCSGGIIALLFTVVAALLNASQCYRQGYIIKRE